MPDEYGIYATNCSHPINYGRYIEDFKCLEESGNRLLKEMRLSFPSGHSSFSMYTMLYCAVSTHTDPSFLYLFIEPFPFWSYSFFSLYRFFARHTHTQQIYLQSRMTWQGSKLLKHFMQYLLLAMTWFTCMSRISDYKHHWSDVLAGGLIGATFAIVVVSFKIHIFA